MDPGRPCIYIKFFYLYMGGLYGWSFFMSGFFVRPVDEAAIVAAVTFPGFPSPGHLSRVLDCAGDGHSEDDPNDHENETKSGTYTNRDLAASALRCHVLCDMLLF